MTAIFIDIHTAFDIQYVHYNEAIQFRGFASSRSISWAGRKTLFPDASFDWPDLKYNSARMLVLVMDATEAMGSRSAKGREHRHQGRDNRAIPGEVPSVPKTSRLSESWLGMATRRCCHPCRGHVLCNQGRRRCSCVIICVARRKYRCRACIRLDVAQPSSTAPIANPALPLDETSARTNGRTA